MAIKSLSMSSLYFCYSSLPLSTATTTLTKSSTATTDDPTCINSCEPYVQGECNWETGTPVWKSHFYTRMWSRRMSNLIYRIKCMFSLVWMGCWHRWWLCQQETNCWLLGQNSETEPCPGDGTLEIDCVNNEYSGACKGI